MNQHVGGGKAKRSLLIFNAEYLVLLDFFTLFFGIAIIHCIGHGSNKKSTTSAAGIQNTGVFVYANCFAHEITDVVRSKRLVLVGLSDIFIECGEEQV